jgi:hypothetical protein
MVVVGITRSCMGGSPRMVAYMERLEQNASCRRHVSNRRVKRILVSARRSVEAADLAHELKRRVVQLLVGWRVPRVSEPFDVSAHVEASFRVCYPVILKSSSVPFEISPRTSNAASALRRLSGGRLTGDKKTTSGR